MPPGPTETPEGRENRAALPAPSALPPSPASPPIVLTTQLVPAGVIFRIVAFPISATYRLPELSTATPEGYRNRALPPTPSALPAFVKPAKPAMVLTTQLVPTAIILLIASLKESATYR